MSTREADSEVATERPEKPHQVRWKAVEWELFEAAADEFSKQQHMTKTTPTDVIRSGAIRRSVEILGEKRAEEILGATAAGQ
jgi:hypothetical protein